MAILSLALFVLLPLATLSSQSRTSLWRAGTFTLLFTSIALAAQAAPAGEQPGQSGQAPEQRAQQTDPSSQPPEKNATHGEKAPRHDSRFDLGISLNGLAGTAAGASGNTGFGARASYYLVKTERAIAFDAEFSEFLAHSPSTILRGGRATQGLFGVKFAGPSEGSYDPRYNVLLKVRPGFISWSDAVTGLAGGPQGLVAARRGRSTNLAIDFGITTDVYLGHEWWSRIDLGDTVVWYQGMKVAGSGAHVPGQTKNNFQPSTGVFYRF
ncbi:MAG TPA: hypothetical protein VF532_13315 [Candidatus Angelobacter sp.]